MKTIQLIIASAAIIFATGCTKDKEVQPQSPNQAQQLIPIPNGDFENWNSLSLQNWKTNSCRLCTPPYETYIIKQDSDFYHGQFAAKFIYNNVYPAKAENKFSVPSHPSNLKAYVKCNLYGTDTVIVKINLFHNLAVVDSGQWIGTSSISNYSQITIPVTQYSSQVDSAMISIQGGHKLGYPGNNTEFWIDYLELQ